jgi:predicted DNA-binding transcriptional regulator AlpA
MSGCQEKPTMQTMPAANNNRPTSETLLDLLGNLAVQLGRIADHFTPPPADVVGTPYVAQRLGCTTDWIAMMVRDGQIPPSCLVSGTGNGKPWKFRRSAIDQWIEQR